MKIFNLQPIKVTEYTFNEEHLAKTLKDGNYESGFGFSSKVIGSLNSMIITFDILYTIDNGLQKESIIPSDNSNKFIIEVEFEVGGGDIFLSYESTCQFNFESENFDADVLSITNFLTNYHTHTKTFLKQYAFKDVHKKEEEVRIKHTFKADALAAIDCLRANNMYEF